MKSYGFEFDHKILNAADYGAHTSRKRYFGCFSKPGIPIIFPTPTHNKKGENGLKKWRPVKEVLDFQDEGKSIFMRKKPLSERTLERIYAGLLKYVAKGDTSFIQKYYSGRPKGKVNSTNEPAPTITTAAGMTLVQPVSLLKYNSTNKKTGIHHPPSIDDPCPTISTQGRLGIINASFIAYYYGQITLSSVQDPCNTLRTKDTGQVIQPQFWIDRQFGNGGGKMSSIDEPIGTLPSVPKANLASAWILSPHFDNKGSSIEEPMKTITANRKHHCLMFPQWGLQCSHSIEKPSPVLPARMDKMYPYVIQADETGIPFAIALFDNDSEATKKIKIFMAAYGIVDIKMRMLRIKELKLITGFDENYVLKGTQQDQKKYIGNAVPVLLAKAIIECFAHSIIEPLNKAA
jgi:DNA (cytosine-5)-methyltransferase 1